MPEDAIKTLRQEHEQLGAKLDRLRELADQLDHANAQAARAIIEEANQLAGAVVAHEKDDEASIYPRIAGYLGDSHGLGAMARAHREIMHLSRLLDRIAGELPVVEIDRYVIRDAQRVIEAIEALVRLHNAQEEDIYEQAAADG
jgi:hypothetical protein